jgi:hypothetical protein
VAVLIPLGPGAKGLAILGVILVPGATATALTGLSLNGLAQRLFLTSVVGIAALLGIGLLAAVVLKPLGVDHPLTRGPMLVVWMLLLVASVVLPARLEKDPVRWLLGGVTRRHGLWLVGLGVLPVLTLLGAGRLNAGHGAALAITSCALCVGVLVFALVSALWGRNDVPAAPTIFMTVVALVWQVSNRGDWLFGTDIQHEYSVANSAAVTGQFALTTHSDAYQAMLSLTVLPAQLHALSSASVEILLQFLPAVVLGLVAVGALCIFRSLVSEGLAVGFTLLFVGVNTALVTELPAVTRQCYGLLMFESMVLIVVLAPQPIRRSRVLAAILGVAMAWSHYSTAYIAVPVLVVGWIFGWVFADRSSDGDDGEAARLLRAQPEQEHVADRSRAVLSTAVVGVTVLAAAVWGLVVAGTGHQLSQLGHSIETKGFAILGGGGTLSRWVDGSGPGSRVANVLADVVLHRAPAQPKAPSWMKIDPRAFGVHLVGASAPQRPAVPVLGPTTSALLGLANAVVIVAAVAAAIISVVMLVRKRHLLAAELVGMAVGAVVIDAVARESGTIAQKFGPGRVEVQLGVLLLVPLAVVVSSAPRPSFRALRAGLVALVAIELVGTTGLLVIAFGGAPDASLSSSGESAERFVVTTPGLYTAGWVVHHASSERIIQADAFGQLALANFTGGRRFATFYTVDPTGVDRFAWIYASPVNVVDGRARTSTNGNVTIFVFPEAFYDQTRPVIFATASTKVYGRSYYGEK